MTLPPMPGKSILKLRRLHPRDAELHEALRQASLALTYLQAKIYRMTKDNYNLATIKIDSDSSGDNPRSILHTKTYYQSEIQSVFKYIARAAADGSPLMLNLADPIFAKVILPLTVIEARHHNVQQVLASAIEDHIAKMITTLSLDEILARQIDLADMSECIDVLCYVGFRRAELISSPCLLQALQQRLTAFLHDRKTLTKPDVRFLSLLLRLARTRFDTRERDAYQEVCLQALNAIRERGRDAVTVHDIYALTRSFAYPARIHPRSYHAILGCIQIMVQNYFDASARHPALAGDNIVKEVAISIVIDRNDYGSEAIRHLQRMHGNEQDPQSQRKIAQRMVEVAYYAGYDDVYGVWKPEYQRLLLNNKHNTYHRFIISALMRFGRCERAHKQIVRIGRRHPQAMVLEASVLRNMSKFDEAERILAEVNDHVIDRLTKGSRILSVGAKHNFRPISLMWSQRLHDELKYILDFENRSRHNQQSEPDSGGDIVVLCPSSFYAFMQIPVQVIRELRKRGASLISMVPGFIRSDPINPDIDTHVTGSLSMHFYSDKTSIAKTLSPKWKISFRDKIAEINGINFYFCLHNTIGITFRRYDIEWDDPLVQSYARRYMLAIEALFDKHTRMVELAQTTRRRVRLVLTEIQHGLSHALRLIAQRFPNDKIDVFHLSNGFEAYHNGLSRQEYAQFQCIANVTRFPDVSLAYRPPHDVFLDWHSKSSDKMRAGASAMAYADKIIAQGKFASAAEAFPGERKLKFQKKPGPVIVLLGKILPDLPRPDDVGFIHEDVKSWFIDCCRTAYELNINLIVKPHPAEFTSLISLYINQDFLSFLNDIPPEMHPYVIDRHSLPITDLPGIADGVILWGGNSLVELGLLEVPTMVCGKYGALDCPVGFPTSETRAQFVEFLSRGGATNDTGAIREKVISFLSYVTHPNHTIPSRFNNRSMYNSEIWPPTMATEQQLSDEALLFSSKVISDYIQGDLSAIVPPLR